MNTLQDQVCIITGASRGIGLSAARLFKAEGAKLVLTAKNNLDSLKEFSGSKVIKFDLADKKSIEFLIGETLKEFKRIDILVQNAAVFYPVEFEEISENELDETIAVDLKGPFLLLQKVIRQMKNQQNGKIINISSLSGKIGSSGAAHYAAAKAGINALTKSLARRYGKYNITVNAVLPSLIDTDMIAQISKERLNRLIENVPLKRLGTPEEAARLILFLASPASGYINGQCIAIDGGLSMT